MQGWIVIHNREMRPKSSVFIKLTTDKEFEQKNIAYEVYSGSTLIFQNYSQEDNKVFVMMVLIFLVIGGAFLVMFLKMYAMQRKAESFQRFKAMSMELDNFDSTNISLIE